MKLRYLTLCSDFFNKGITCSDDELRAMGVRLSHESAYITDYIKRGVNEEFKFDCLRLNLNCTVAPIRDKIMEFESVHEIDVPFNLDYYSMTAKQKEEYLIDVTELGLIRFCNAKGWDFSVFKKHIDLLRSNSNYTEFYIPKKTCRKEKLSAKVYCVQNMTESIYFMDFFYNRTLIQRKLFAVSWPDTMTYRSDIYSLKWTSEDTVSVYTYTNQLYAQVTLDAAIPQSKASDITINDYKEQIARVYRVKTLCAEKLGKNASDIYIESWEENMNGQVFIEFSLPKYGYQRHLTLVSSSGEVICGYNDNFQLRQSVINDFKQKNGWIYN